jgi:hypothetical protein
MITGPKKEEEEEEGDDCINRSFIVCSIRLNMCWKQEVHVKF